MSTDIRVYSCWQHHRKRRRLQRRLGSEGVLAVMDLWSFAGQHRGLGDLAGLSNEDLADEVGWAGDADELVAVLLEVGLLDGEPGSLRIHNWATRQPWAIGQQERTDQARKAALIRWSKIRETKTQKPLDAGSIRGACWQHAGSNAGSNARSNAGSNAEPRNQQCSQPNPTQPRSI
jgi:hypothetical protein